VPADIIDEAESRWAPPDDPVFQLVPASFLDHIVPIYEALGSPTISFDSMWGVFCQLRDAVIASIVAEHVTNELHAQTDFEQRMHTEYPPFPGEFNPGPNGIFAVRIH
jgi:hypothetical protein